MRLLSFFLCSSCWNLEIQAQKKEMKDRGEGEGEEEKEEEILSFVMASDLG